MKDPRMTFCNVERPGAAGLDVTGRVWDEVSCRGPAGHTGARWTTGTIPKAQALGGPASAAVPSIPPSPMVSTTDEGTITIEPFSLIAS